MLSFADDTKQTIYKYIAWVFGFGVLRMKERLAKEFPDKRDSYILGKQAFIEEVLRKARVWRRQ